MKKSVIAITTIVTLLVSSFVFAGPHFGRHGMHNPLEKMIDHIDLTEDQELQVEQIFAKLEEKGDKKGKMRLFKDMVSLDPDSSDYMQKSEQKADLAAEKMKLHILAMAKARKDIYEILDEEQKAELQRVINKKMKRMAKRFEHH